MKSGFHHERQLRAKKQGLKEVEERGESVPQLQLKMKAAAQEFNEKMGVTTQKEVLTKAGHTVPRDAVLRNALRANQLIKKLQLEKEIATKESADD